jgi:uncharacterized protein with GYD domain
MAKFLIEASYTADGLKGLKKDTAAGRRKAVENAAKKLGGKLESVHFALGEYDVIVILELPNTVSAAAVALAVGSSGLVRPKTTALLTVEETDQALAMTTGYKAPGQG